MRLSAFLTLLFIASFGHPQDKDKDAVARDEMKKLAGTWEVVRAEKNGTPVPEDVRKSIRVEFEGDVMRIRDTRGTDKSRYTIDPSARPHSIEFLLGVNRETFALGIYELNEGKLTLCWSKQGGVRPAKFASDDKEMTTVFVLEPAKK